MNIGFDAKRAFHNARGLGNYSRDAIRLLSTYYPENNHFLFNPTQKNNLNFPVNQNVIEVLPESWLGRTIPALWRSVGICSQIKSNKIDIYHGLSQELPWGISKSGAKSVVTMHDAIFMRYPQLYPATYRAVFTEKNKYACRQADRIIAISEQTKRDIIHYFGADENKISVVYQGCSNVFREPITDEKKQEVRRKYNLPSEFLLNVGAIEKRKNALLIIEAIHRKRLQIPLVILGKPTSYMDELRFYISTYKLENQVHFIHNAESADLPAIYALSEIFVYPSIFEGFGIPVLEALCTRTPVISSTGSCFEETGGPNSCYVNPTSADELGDAIEQILRDSELKETMRKEGLLFAQKFADSEVATNLMNVYLSL